VCGGGRRKRKVVSWRRGITIGSRLHGPRRLRLVRRLGCTHSQEATISGRHCRARLRGGGGSGGQSGATFGCDVDDSAQKRVWHQGDVRWGAMEGDSTQHATHGVYGLTEHEPSVCQTQARIPISSSAALSER
jgi:hypothetical protein